MFLFVLLYFSFLSTKQIATRVCRTLLMAPSSSILTACLLIAAVTTMMNVAPVVGLPTADEVLSLPGWNEALPSRHFSGFVSNDDDAFLHYYWVFPENVPPETAPVIFWTNGGPGCSSMEGWGYEIGPFTFLYWNTTAAEGVNGYNGTAPFARNPYTWARNAHVVFVENPPGVGFSYRTDDNDFAINDTANAISNYNALVHIFQDKFPEYRTNGLFLSGESYAGIYVPMLAQQILSEGVPAILSTAFKGIIVGNGVTDNAYDNNFATSTGLFAVNHGLILTQEFQTVVEVCRVDGSINTACNELFNTFADMFNHLNWYGFSGWCYNPDASTASGSGDSLSTSASQKMKYRRARRAIKNSEARTVVGRGEGPTQASRFSNWYNYMESVLKRDNTAAAGAVTSSSQNHHQRQQLYRRRRVDSASSTSLNGVPHNGVADDSVDCGDEVFLDRYLSRADVRAAMNVPADFVGTFRVCYDIPYTSNVDSVVDIYNTLQANNKTIVIYNGDMDLVVPYTGTFQWIAGATDWIMARNNAPWVFVDEDRPAYGLQTGGQAFQLTTGSSTEVPPLAQGVWVVLVNGAGHMVPEDRPAAAFEMIQRVITGNMFSESAPVSPAVSLSSTSSIPNHDALLGAPLRSQKFVAPDVAAVAFGVGGGVAPSSDDQSFWDKHGDIIIGLLIGIGAAQLWCTIIYFCCCRNKSRSAMPFAMAKDDQGLFSSPDRYM